MKNSTIMTKYEFLLKLQASGELRTLVKNGFEARHQTAEMHQIKPWRVLNILI